LTLEDDPSRPEVKRHLETFDEKSLVDHGRSVATVDCADLAISHDQPSSRSAVRTLTRVARRAGT
jgi:hypothetical protein